MRVFMKKSRIIKAAVVIIALVAVVISAIAGAQQTMVECETCHASGKVNTFNCAECDGTGKGEGEAVCSTCTGKMRLTMAEVENDETYMNFIYEHDKDMGFLGEF